MDKKTYEVFKSIKLKLQNNQKTSFAERNMYNMIQKKVIKKKKLLAMNNYCIKNV
jgi:hypothetical protein